MDNYLHPDFDHVGVDAPVGEHIFHRVGCLPPHHHHLRRRWTSQLYTSPAPWLPHVDRKAYAYTRFRFTIRELDILELTLPWYYRARDQNLIDLFEHLLRQFWTTRMVRHLNDNHAAVRNYSLL